MWRLLHFLFGWDYVHWSNTADQGIARVYVAADGTVYYWRYRACLIMDRIPDSYTRITWLTCGESKYIKAK